MRDDAWRTLYSWCFGAMHWNMMWSRRENLYFYISITTYIIVRFDEVCVSFMDSEKDCQCSKSFSIFRNKATCPRQWCTRMYAELYQTLIPKQILKISNNFRWQMQDVLRNLSSQQITKNTTRKGRPLHKGSEQVCLTMRQGQRVVSWRDAKGLNTKQVTEVTSLRMFEQTFQNSCGCTNSPQQNQTRASGCWLHEPRSDCITRWDLELEGSKQSENPPFFVAICQNK